MNVNIYGKSFNILSYYHDMKHSGFFLVLVDEQIMRNLLHLVSFTTPTLQPNGNRQNELKTRATITGQNITILKYQTFYISRSGNGNRWWASASLILLYMANKKGTGFVHPDVWYGDLAFALACDWGPISVWIVSLSPITRQNFGNM